MNGIEWTYKKSGWHLVTRSSDDAYLIKRSKEMRLQGWEVLLLPYGRTVKSLWTAPGGTMKPGVAS